MRPEIYRWKMTENQYYVFDFDSTFVQVEALEELAEITLKGDKNREKALEQIKQLTDQGIEGQISFTDGLRKRLAILARISMTSTSS